MTDLKQLLTEVAEQAPTYQVKEQALAAARKRRQMRRIVPAAAGLAVVLGIGAALLVPRSEEPAPVAGSWLPNKIEKPTRTPKLPADRAVGRGSVIYTPCKSVMGAKCREYLITQDGTHYLIPGSSDKWGNQDTYATLSPDGRWLGVTRKGEYRLRDLTGTRTYTVQGDGLVGLGWSPDSRWLLVGPAGVGPPNPKPRPIWRLDTRTGETVQVRAPFQLFGRFVIDVNRRGEVLLYMPDEECRQTPLMCYPSQLSEVALMDPDRGEKPIWTRELDYDALRDGEAVRGARLSPDGKSVLVALIKTVKSPDGGVGDLTTGDLLSYDLATGTLIRRYDIRDGSVGFKTPDGGPEGIRSRWRLMAHEGDGILLHGSKKPYTPDVDRYDSYLDVVDPRTGEQRRVTRAPKIAVIAVRGSTAYPG